MVGMNGTEVGMTNVFKRAWTGVKKGGEEEGKWYDKVYDRVG